MLQVESSLATQNLKPTIDAIKARYGKDQEKIRRETQALYDKSGVKPLAGALWSTECPVFAELHLHSSLLRFVWLVAAYQLPEHYLSAAKVWFLTSMIRVQNCVT